MLEANDIIAEQAAMETSRSQFEDIWSEVSALMLPRQSDFLASEFGSMTQGQVRTDRITDETALQSMDHGTAVFEGEVIPQGGQWQRLTARDPDLMKKRHVALFYERLGDRLFALRNSPYSGFANQTHESVASLLAFGFQGMTTDLLTDERGVGIGLRYRSEHIGQLFVRCAEGGTIDTTHRKFRLTHEQAWRKWGERAPECVQRARGHRDPKQMQAEATYLHRLTPNLDYDPDRIDWRGKPILSAYICLDSRQTFDVGGFRKRPLTCSRFEKSPMEDYGRSPGINCLPAAKAAQQIKTDLVTAIEFMARPALGAHSDMLDQLINYAPDSVTYGAIDDRGNPTIRRMWDDPDIGPALQLLQETQAVIRRAFYEDLYVVRQELKSHISATEQMMRDQQRGILLAPLKRQENEWFTPQTERELDLMADMGMLDDMPEEVREAGGLYQIVYENPLSRARKAEQAGGFYQMMNGVAPLMQLDPENTVPAFFRRYPFERTLDGLAAVHGVPVAWSATEEEQAESEADARALADKASLLEVGERGAAIAKDLAQALPAPQQTAGGAL